MCKEGFMSEKSMKYLDVVVKAKEKRFRNMLQQNSLRYQRVKLIGHWPKLKQ